MIVATVIVSICTIVEMLILKKVIADVADLFFWPDIVAILKLN